MSIQDLVSQSPCKIDFDDSDSGKEYSQHSTPIKHNQNDSQTSLRIETDEIEQQKISNTRQSGGLLTFSNLNSAFMPVKNCNLFHSTPKTLIKKPRVNFHSIDDIVNGGKTADDSEDSGIQSNSNSAVNASNFETSQPKIEVNEYEDNENKENDSKKHNNNKKIRTTFTDQQKWMLDQYFKQNPYPDPRETEDLSKQLVLPENVIKVWFQNKRSRDKQRKFSSNNKSTTPSISDSIASSLSATNLPFNPANLGHLAALQSHFLSMF